jgi:hypothetical protein
MEESALGTFLWKGHRPCTKKSPSDDFRSQVVRQASRKNNANIREKQGTSQLVKKKIHERTYLCKEVALP